VIYKDYHEPKDTGPEKKELIQVGMHGFFKFKNKTKKHYPGYVLKIHHDGSFDIRYEDGDSETRAKVVQLLLPENTRIIGNFERRNIFMKGE